MANTSLGDTPVHTTGEPPAVGTTAPDFTLTGVEFNDVTRTAGVRAVLNVFPSIATGVCQASVRKFNELAAGLDNAEVLCISNDLPFALASFCGAEGIDGVVVGSGFRSSFGADYGLTMADGNWSGLLARTVLVLDTDGTVLYTEVVPAISQEPDYDAAIAALG